MRAGLFVVSPIAVSVAILVAPAILAAPAFADPVPRINIALERDGRAVAATTTLDDGGATLQAPRDGEYGLAMQSPLPTEVRLTATVAGEVWSVDLPAGEASRDAALAFPASAGDVIELCLQTAQNGEASASSIPSCAAETTTGAGHQGLPAEELPVSDIDPTRPSPAEQ
jgi:hypothetical protein